MITNFKFYNLTIKVDFKYSINKTGEMDDMIFANISFNEEKLQQWNDLMDSGSFKPITLEQDLTSRLTALSEDLISDIKKTIKQKSLAKKREKSQVN